MPLEDEWSGTDKMLPCVREGVPVFITPFMVLDSSNHVLRCKMGIGIEIEGGMKIKQRAQIQCLKVLKLL